VTRQLAAAFVVLACVTPAAAQSTGSDRPFRGLFGGRETRPATQTLNVAATAVEAYDDNLLAEGGSVFPGAATRSGSYTLIQGSTEYAGGNRTIQVGANLVSAWRYYAQSQDGASGSYSGGAGISANLPRRTSVSLNQTAAYSPSYLFGLFPALQDPELGQAQAVAPDYAVNDQSSYSYGSTLTLTHGLTRRSSLTFTGDYTLTDFLSEAVNALPDRRSISGRIAFSRSVGRYASFKAGYRQRVGEFGTTEQGVEEATERGVDFGFEFSRVLSATRRARFSFGFGVTEMTAAVDQILGVPLPVPEEPASADANPQLYSWLADIGVLYPLGRTWQARGTYRRSLEYIPQLTDPVFTDALSASVDGMLTRRLDLALAASVTTGDSALYSTPSFDTYTASVRSRFALARTTAVYVEYLYYFYDFRGNEALAPGLPPTLERNGVRAGLTFFMPAFRR
jgi:hypothetical protein